ncbi:MAG: tetratricopeptide repeat protein [Methanotrichaceae archaeon]|nr:tetratricopeptide repeat protein [Methanotrichaceae archaeon]
MKPDLVLVLAEAGTPSAPAISLSISAGDEAVLEDQLLTPVLSLQAGELQAQYFSLFEEGCRPEGTHDYFDILGQSMFHLFLEKSWHKIGPKIAEGARVLVVSEIPRILSLPWERISLPKSPPGLDERFSIRRVPAKSGPVPFEGELFPGPLRVLFLASGPGDVRQEEARFLRSLEGLDLEIEISESGSFEDLQELAEEFHPHVVQLVGPCRMKDGASIFAFDGAAGRPDPKPARELGPLLSRAGVHLVICSGCQVEKPSALDLLSQDLAGHVPMAVCWNSPADCWVGFYHLLTEAGGLDEALIRARLDGQRICQDQGRLCALPVLYTKFGHDRIFDSQRRIETSHRIRKQHPVSGIFEGYAADFVNRRADLARLLPAFSEGAVRSLVITGPHGAGKSTLCSVIAGHLAITGFVLIPVYASRNNPLSAARILEAGIKTFAAQGLTDIALRLRDPGISREERQKIMIDAINHGRFLLVLDGLRLDPKSGKIEDPELSEFYRQVLRGMENGRAMVTCETLPKDALTLPARAWEWSVGPLPEAAFIRFLLKDQRVSERYSNGDLTYLRLQDLFGISAGLPACLPQIRASLASGGRDLKDCDKIWEGLKSQLDSGEQLALRRLAVYETAFIPEFLASSSAQASKDVQSMLLRWQGLSLAQEIKSGLWIIQSQVRSWLLSACSAEEKAEANRAAGAFLRDIAEAGRSSELGLSRLDLLMEARGQYLQAGEWGEARATTARICSYLELRGYYYQMRLLNEELLKFSRHPEPMNWIARSYLDQGSYSLAQKWYSKALELGPDSQACYGLGAAYLQQGRHDLARERFETAAEICGQSGDLLGKSAALQGLASIDIAQEKTDSALEKLQEVLAVQETLGNFKGQAATLTQKSTLHLQRGEMKEAREVLARSAEILQQVGDKRSQASALFNLASIDLGEERFEEARGELEKALALNREVGNLRGQAAVLHSIGSIHSQAGDKDQARRNFVEALAIYQELGDKPGEAGAFFQLGAVAVQLNMLAEGLRLMAISAVILRSISSEDVKNVEPVVERLASKLSYSQDQFMIMVNEVIDAYRRDRGRALIAKAFPDES